MHKWSAPPNSRWKQLQSILSKGVDRLDRAVGQDSHNVEVKSTEGADPLPAKSDRKMNFSLVSCCCLKEVVESWWRNWNKWKETDQIKPFTLQTRPYWWIPPLYVAIVWPKSQFDSVVMELERVKRPVLFLRESIILFGANALANQKKLFSEPVLTRIGTLRCLDQLHNQWPFKTRPVKR